MSKEYDEHNPENPEGRKKKSRQEEFPLQEYRLVPVEEWEGAGAQEDEIDLIELARHIWDNRVLIYKFVAAGVVLGVLVALLSPKEYQSSATLMPEYSSESQGGAAGLIEQYGGLIGLSGASYAGSSNAIRVELYPKIVQSLPFMLKLMDQQFYYEGYDTTATVYEYFNEIYTPSVLSYLTKYTIGLPFLIKDAITGEEQPALPLAAQTEDGVVSVTEDQMEVIENLRGRVTASLDEETGIVSVSAKMPEAKVAAQVAKFTIDELTQYLAEYRTEKVMVDLEFVEEQLAEAKARFEQAQLELAEFQDSNEGSLSAKARIEQQRLQSQYDLAFNVYNTLAQQFEQAKLKVQEETPVFKVLQPVQVPVNDETSGLMVLIVFVMLSVIISLGWIFIRQFLSSNPFGN